MIMNSFYLHVISILSVLSSVSLESDAPVSVKRAFTIIAKKSEKGYKLPKLPYGLGDLEPYIDEATVKAHYLGHHDAYRKKMNLILKEWQDEDVINHLNTDPIYQVLQYIDKVNPESRRQKLKNNAGGFVNHAIYWGIMSPNENGIERYPTGAFMREFESSFGSYDNFKTRFTSEALNFFGSGYVWLVTNPNLESGSRMSIVTTKDQDSPLSQGLDPLLVFDVWEHAYYLKHQFRRSEHIADWWMVVDWEAVEELDLFWIKLREPREEEPINEQDFLDFYKELEEFDKEHPSKRQDKNEKVTGGEQTPKEVTGAEKMSDINNQEKSEL